MIHYRENCKCITTHTHSDICTECSWYNHADFIYRFTNHVEASDPIEQKIVNRIRTDPTFKYRIGKKRHRNCGHPGVWQNTTCAFCAQEARDTRNKPAPTQLEQLRKTATQLRDNLEKVEQMVGLLEIGFPVGKAPQIESPRQVAMREGKKWYIPLEPCTRCHTLSERYVANGRCRGCE